MQTIAWIIGYFVTVNLFGFALMGIDKKRAKNHEWRISEAMLFLAALIGGSLGSILGMNTFRHKTKHLKFVIGMPLILVIQIALLLIAFFFLM